MTLEPAHPLERNIQVGARVQVSLVCTVCESRNYQTTRRLDQAGRLEVKKYCPKCDRHTAFAPLANACGVG